ncbi:hypothetical protein ACFRAR_20540 [Kitasatospora sp. NPDC056651]|uniref:hypothetical protein n=1 Tax=Kitasatospora sp. NPDC056651 TaxID=3345892 RepID=UPI0036D0FE1C
MTAAPVGHRPARNEHPYPPPSSVPAAPTAAAADPHRSPDFRPGRVAGIAAERDRVRAGVGQGDADDAVVEGFTAVAPLVPRNLPSSS